MGTVAASGNNQLYLVLFIEYAYQTLFVCPMLYRYQLILLLHFVILLFFIVTLHSVYTLHIVSITHCIHILNHCNDLALNGSLIGNKHICMNVHGIGKLLLLVLYCIYFKTTCREGLNSWTMMLKSFSHHQKTVSCNFGFHLNETHRNREYLSFSSIVK